MIGKNKMNDKELLQPIHGVLVFAVMYTTIVYIAVGIPEDSGSLLSRALSFGLPYLWVCHPYGLLLLISHTSTIKKHTCSLFISLLTAILVILCSLCFFIYDLFLNQGPKSGGLFFAFSPMVLDILSVSGLALSLVAIIVTKMAPNKGR